MLVQGAALLKRPPHSVYFVIFALFLYIFRVSVRSKACCDLLKVGLVLMLAAIWSNAFQFDNLGSVPSKNQSYSNATHSNRMLNYIAAEADGSAPLARCCDPSYFVK